MTYYVYMLIDPRKNLPFYVGKGTGRRARTHLWKNPDTRNQYKENIIASIRAEGLEPEIRYVVENLEDEKLAYKIETELIKHYGRKGYDKDGILSNVCENAAPPNHKGKTYEQIYGSKERAEEQRLLRIKIQKERGGFGPKFHSEETKRKLSEKSKGRKYGPCSEERKQKIRENRKPAKGENHYLSKHWILTSPSGEVFSQIGNLAGLCSNLGLPYCSIKEAYRKNRIPKCGRSKGWRITTKDELAITTNN